MSGHGAPVPFVDPMFAEELSGRRPIGQRSDRRSHHKTMQLCRQVQRVLGLSLAGECDDELLRSCYLDSVEPAPDALRLLVRLIVPAGMSPLEVLSRIECVTPKLRADVARAITRKRAPELTFLPIIATHEPGEISP
jgi:ribosome-binding factor A